MGVRPLERGMAMAALQFALNRLFMVTANLGTVFEDVSGLLIVAQKLGKG